MCDPYYPRTSPPPYSEYPPPPPPGVHHPPHPQNYVYSPTAPILHNCGTYGSTQDTITTTTIIVPEPEVIVVGACPACRIGVLEDDFTCTGVLCALLFFPIGILFCLLLKEKRCCNCGARFG